MIKILLVTTALLLGTAGCVSTSQSTPQSTPQISQVNPVETLAGYCSGVYNNTIGVALNSNSPLAFDLQRQMWKYIKLSALFNEKFDVSYTIDYVNAKSDAKEHGMDPVVECNNALHKFVMRK